MTRALASFLLIHVFMLVAVVALGCDLLIKHYGGPTPTPRVEDDAVL